MKCIGIVNKKNEVCGRPLDSEDTFCKWCGTPSGGTTPDFKKIGVYPWRYRHPINFYFNLIFFPSLIVLLFGLGWWLFSPQNYNIGDIGSGGGIVFYDKGDTSDGWRYLEVAYYDVDVAAFRPRLNISELSSDWRNFRDDINAPTYTKVGVGPELSRMWANFIEYAAMRDENEPVIVCLNWGQRRKDWYHPNLEELRVLYAAFTTNVAFKDLSGKRYLSLSVNQQGAIQSLNFANGNVETATRSGQNLRAIRRVENRRVYQSLR